MPHEHAEAIEEVVTQVLEQLAFIFADPADAGDVQEPPTGAVGVTLKFHGAGDGVLTVFSGPEVCEELAANLTDDAESDAEAGRQALMELVNVMCGQLLTAIAGREPVFDLEPPVLAEPDDAAWRSIVSDDRAVAFLIDDCPMLLRFDLQQAA